MMRSIDSGKRRFHKQMNSFVEIPAKSSYNYQEELDYLSNREPGLPDISFPTQPAKFPINDRNLIQDLATISISKEKRSSGTSTGGRVFFSEDKPKQRPLVEDHERKALKLPLTPQGIKQNYLLLPVYRL